VKAEDIFKEKPFLNYADIMKIFRCGENKARAIIRAIKSVSDTIPIQGKVAQVDYEKWLKGGERDA